MKKLTWLHSLFTLGSVVPRQALLWQTLCKYSFEKSDSLRLFIKNILMSVKCLKLKWDMKISFHKRDRFSSTWGNLSDMVSADRGKDGDPPRSLPTSDSIIALYIFHTESNNLCLRQLLEYLRTKSEQNSLRIFFIL